MRTVISLALIGALWAQDDAWSRVMQLAPRADIKVELRETPSYRGAFRTADDQSITLVVGGHDQTVERGRVRRISLNRGTHHRRRNVAIGVVLAAIVTSLTCLGKGPECTEASPLTFYPLAGAGALIGGSVPSGDWQEIYRAGSP